MSLSVSFAVAGVVVAVEVTAVAVAVVVVVATSRQIRHSAQSSKPKFLNSYPSTPPKGPEPEALSLVPELRLCSPSSLLGT